MHRHTQTHTDTDTQTHACATDSVYDIVSFSLTLSRACLDLKHGGYRNSLDIVISGCARAILLAVHQDKGQHQPRRNSPRCRPTEAETNKNKRDLLAVCDEVIAISA